MGTILKAFALATLAMPLLQLRLQAQNNVAERYLLAAANQERAARSLLPLAWDEALAGAAANHARVMAQHRDISHRFTEESELTGRGAAAGARFSVIAENVAAAPSAPEVQDAWMTSEGHRANLLDPEITSVGIAVAVRDGQLYAVEDFARVTPTLTFEQQESAVMSLLARSGVDLLPANPEARPTCALESGFRGVRRPGFIIRFTASALDRLPEELTRRLATRQYRQAAVGACPDADSDGFTSYRLAVLLYR